jgi:hypothetical protein
LKAVWMMWIGLVPNVAAHAERADHDSDTRRPPTGL